MFEACPRLSMSDGCTVTSSVKGTSDPGAAVFADGVAAGAAARLQHLGFAASRELDGALVPADDGQAIAEGGRRRTVGGEGRGVGAGLLVRAAALAVVVGVDGLGEREQVVRIALAHERPVRTLEV